MPNPVSDVVVVNFQMMRVYGEEWDVNAMGSNVGVRLEYPAGVAECPDGWTAHGLTEADLDSLREVVAGKAPAATPNAAAKAAQPGLILALVDFTAKCVISFNWVLIPTGPAGQVLLNIPAMPPPTATTPPGWTYRNLTPMEMAAVIMATEGEG